MRQPRQLPMVPCDSINKSLVNQRSLPEDFSDAYLRETYSSKFTTYLRKAIADKFVFWHLLQFAINFLHIQHNTINYSVYVIAGDTGR